ncbi:MAG TPA: YggT family protein [Chloroflexi bacterium]|nr:YggT family protein [Chloroflexota bacterium]
MIFTIIDVIRQTIYLLVLLKVILSYFMDPYHPFRQSIDRLIDPLLKPIRQVIPTVGRFDFSPILLIIIVEVIAMIIKSLL